MWPWWVKITSEDFTNETLAINDIQGDDVRGGVVFKVLVMEVDKVADEVTDMEVDQHDSEDNQWRLFWYYMVFMELMLALVMDMGVDKVADEVVNMEVDMGVDWHGVDN